MSSYEGHPGGAELIEDKRDVRPHNLPTQLTPLIGREQEIATVGTLLRQPTVRLVTLTGTGGVGKTRLGLRVGTDLLPDFADGVYFVPLAPISDPNLVIPSIAQILGLKEAGERPVLDILQAHVREKHILLLLDNFEQVTTAAVWLSELLAVCFHLKILVTSRAVLHLRSEHEFLVPPLSLPDLTHLPESNALMQYASVALFQQRAQAVKPDFQVTPHNARTIAEICVRLDGLPLAIELAAARVKLLPPQALLTRLRNRLQVLVSGTQDVPLRQQTLRNTLAWSYDLLDAEDQLLFQRLSVFVGGCTLEAVEGFYSALGDTSTFVLDRISSLLDKSLLRQIEQEGGEPRLWLLEVIREYGLEILVANGTIEPTRHAHALYYLSLVEQAEIELEGSQQVAWLDRLEQEHDNLRAALQWSLEHIENNAQMEDSIEIALKLGGALRKFWVVHGHITEGRNFLERALIAREKTEIFVQAKALIAAANLAFIQSDYDRTEVLLRESLSLYRELEDQLGIAFALSLLGSVAWTKGNMVASRTLTEEALAIARQVEAMELEANSLFILGLLSSSLGEYTSASTLFRESLAIHRTIGDKRGIAHTVSQLAQVLLVSQANLTEVSPMLEECLTLSQEMGFKEGIAAYYCISGQLALGQGDLATARSLADKSIALYREMGHRHGLANSLGVLGKVCLTEGSYAEAQALYEQSITISSELSEKWVASAFLLELGKVVVAQRQFAWATQLWGTADALRNTFGVPIPLVQRSDYESLVSAARLYLGERAFTTAWAQGRDMTPEQVLRAKGKKPLPPPPLIKMTQPNPAGLTAREVEVLRLLATGLTDQQIAEQLTLSPRTVHTHISSIYSKLGLTSRSAATRFAIEHHLA